MRTKTHILTLLIAATMILSSAVTMASVNENTIIVEEDITNPTAPASVGGYETDGFVPGVPEINTLLDKLIKYRGSTRADAIVYDNGLDYNMGGSSQEDTNYPLSTRLADDFTFVDDQNVEGVNWVGCYYTGVTPSPHFDWGIEFYVDDGTGNAPGAMIDSFTFSPSDITFVDLGAEYWEMQAYLPASITFDGGQKYWIAIFGVGFFPPQTGMGAHDSHQNGHEASFKGAIFGFPDWVDAHIVFGGGPWDMAFQLTHAAMHDVFVDEIIAPTDGSVFCPCTPVEVTVTNEGIADEVDVPVSVEIRRNLMCEGFEAPPAPPAWPPTDPMFGPWSLVNGGEGPATWQSVNDPVCNWGIKGDGFPSGAISGDFAYANSDGAPSSEWMIEDLITPPLPPGSGAPYMVEFDYEIYSPFGEDITVWIAPTFGGPWTMAGPAIFGAEAVGHWVFDLMMAAPVMTWPAVYVSWTYNDYDAWGYDAAIDNIMIYDMGAPWMVFETFTVIPAPPSFPPAGWTEQPISGGDWDQVTSETATPFRAIPIDGAMAEFMSGLMNGDARLYTMPFDFTDACNPMVSFYMWHDTYGSDDLIQVQVNAGSGWVNVGDPYERLCCPGCPDGWIEHIIDLGAYAGMTGVEIGFLGVSDGNPGAYNLQIDDVCVYDQEYYEEMEVDVASFETVNVEFPEWCICNWQDPAWADTYEDIVVVAKTNLDTDEIPDNDRITEDVTVYIPFLHDVAAISIDEPVDTVPLDTFEMCGTIKNVGQYEECCFSTYMYVYREDPAAAGPGFNVLFEDFEGSWPPAGWSIENPGTATWNTNTYWTRSNYPGSGICADIDSDHAGSSAHTAGELWTPSFDLGVAKTATLEFDASYNFIGGAEYFDVDVSDDGGSNWNNELHWTEDHSAYGPGEHVTIDLTPYCGTSDVIVRFLYDDMNVWAWWMEIDNVDINVGSTKGFFTTPEYEDAYCIDDIDVCEEVQICFDDWTPALPYPDCGALSYKICMETAMYDPPDQNALNDIVCEYLTVEFWHDVSVEITSPAKRAQTFYAVDAGNDNFVSFDPVDPGTYTVISPSGFSAFPQGACFVDNVMWTCDTNGLIYTRDELTGTMTFVGSSGAAGGLVALAYDDTSGTLYGGSVDSLYTINMGTGAATLVGGYGGAVVSLMISIDCDFAGNMYGLELSFGSAPLHSIDKTTGICTPIGNTGLALNFGQDISYDKDNDILYGTLFNYGTYQGEFHTIDTATGVATLVGVLDSGAQTTCFAIPYVGGGPQPPPPVDIWVACGEQDFCATFENLGTFDEPGCVIDWNLSVWDDGPQYVTGGSETIDLDAGEVVEDYCFGSYDFVDDGVYVLYVEIIAPVIDCYTDNNEDDLVIGVDCCPPETTFVLDPEQPNGENNWYTTAVTAIVDAVDCCDPPETGSGVKEIKYKINGVEGTITGDHGTITVQDDGVHLVELWAIDNAGNEEVDHHTFEVAIDSGDPVVDLVYEAYEEDDGWHVDFTASVSDDTSGIDKVEFYIGSSLEGTLTEAPFVWSIAWEDGYESETFKATAYDNAGNSASDTVDGSIIEAVSVSFSQPSVPVSVVQQQTKTL